MQAEDLKFFQDRLLRERDRILRGATNTKLLHWENDTGAPDIADQATASSERLLLSSLSTNDERILREIEQALRRIEDGTYGICESCGAEISMRRLRVLPYATRCVQCKTASERQER